MLLVMCLLLIIFTNTTSHQSFCNNGSNSASASLPLKQFDSRSNCSEYSLCAPRLFTNEKNNDLNTTLIDDIPKKSEDQKSLSGPFREYLLSRSVLTATPIDLSILNKSNDDDRLTDSLLYCLDGNVPSDLTSSIGNLAVDISNRSPLKHLNCELSPNRKRCGSTIDSMENKKVMIEKENLNHFELRETDL